MNQEQESLQTTVLEVTYLGRCCPSLELLPYSAPRGGAQGLSQARKHSPKLLGTERTVQGGSIYNVPDSQLSTYPRKQDFPLLLFLLLALFKYYSWCQENGKESLGGAVRGEIQEDNSGIEKETGKERGKWGGSWGVGGDGDAGYCGPGEMTIVT